MAGNRSAARSALQSIARDASRARLGDKLPEDERNALRIEIGLGRSLDTPKSSEPTDPDAEVYDLADDDDEELPGHMRGR